MKKFNKKRQDKRKQLQKLQRLETLKQHHSWLFEIEESGGNLLEQDLWRLRLEVIMDCGVEDISPKKLLFKKRDLEQEIMKLGIDNTPKTSLIQILLENTDLTQQEQDLYKQKSFEEIKTEFFQHHLDYYDQLNKENIVRSKGFKYE